MCSPGGTKEAVASARLLRQGGLAGPPDRPPSVWPAGSIPAGCGTPGSIPPFPTVTLTSCTSIFRTLQQRGEAPRICRFHRRRSRNCCAQMPSACHGSCCGFYLSPTLFPLLGSRLIVPPGGGAPSAACTQLGGASWGAPRGADFVTSGLRLGGLGSAVTPRAVRVPTGALGLAREPDWDEIPILAQPTAACCSFPPGQQRVESPAPASSGSPIILCFGNKLIPYRGFRISKQLHISVMQLVDHSRLCFPSRTRPLALSPCLEKYQKGIRRHESSKQLGCPVSLVEP